MRKAVVVGFDYHVGIFCRNMNSHTTKWRFLGYPRSKLGLLRAAVALQGADALITFGGLAPYPLLLAVARFCRVPVIAIWVGSDVTRAISRPDLVTQTHRSEHIHLAIAPWLAAELKHIDIDAQYIPLIGVSLSPVDISRDDFSVVSYLPEPRRDFYGQHHVYEVARQLPDVTFSIIGAGSRDSSAPSNIRFYGWTPDVKPLLEQSTVLLRVPDHDGMSLTVLEALAIGRYVAWKYEVPGVKQVSMPDDTLRYLRELQQRQLEGSLRRNEAGIDYVTSTYEEEQVAVGVEKFMDEIVKTPQAQRPKARKIAVFGEENLAAEVAGVNNRMVTGWDAHVLQLSTKYEVAESLYRIATSDAVYTIGTPQLPRSMSMVARVLRKQCVKHWVGSPLEAAWRKPGILRTLPRPNISHLAQVNWEVDELAILGIKAGIAPLPARFVCPRSIPPLPRVFTLLIYLWRLASEFDGSRDLDNILRAFRGRQMRFLVIGGGNLGPPPGVKVEYLDWLPSMSHVFAETTAVLRLTPSDGLSTMVLEALAYGRHVLWTRRFPFVKQVLTVEEVCLSLEELVRAHEDGVLGAQQDAAKFIKSRYDPDNCVRDIADAWNKAVWAKGIQRSQVQVSCDGPS